MTDVLASHYMAGIVGVALLRHWYEPGAENDKRMGELASILEGLDEFREHLGGELTITLVPEIGKKLEVHEMDRAKILVALERLRERASVVA